MSRHQHERYRTGFAIVRIDRALNEHPAKVVKVLFDADEAESEAQRLNGLNGGEYTSYEVQTTHVWPMDKADGESA